MYGTSSLPVGRLAGFAIQRLLNDAPEDMGG
jgi:hypothetical protein